MASARPIKFPSANWSVPLTLSAMDLGMSSGWAASFVAEFCGVPDFPTAERAMPHMTRRVATRKRLILASGIQERIREPRREVERAAHLTNKTSFFSLLPYYKTFALERLRLQFWKYAS